VALIFPALFPGVGQVALCAVPGVIAAITRDAEFKKVASIVLLTGIGVVLILLFFEMFDAALLLSQSATLAIILILALRREWSGVTALFFCFFAMVLIFVVTIGIGSGGDFLIAFSEIKRQFSEEFGNHILFYMDAKTQPLPPEWEAWRQDLKDFIISFLPALMGIVFLLISFLNVVISKRIMKGSEKAYTPAFDLWKLPECLVWLVIIAGSLSIFTGGYFKFIGYNSLLMLASFYFIQGISITIFYFNGLKIPRFVRIIIYILISLHWYGLLTVSIIGLLDVWFNLRSRLQPMQSRA
jgi:uncharacterized protein YybS (DUF2232 family)